MNSKFIKGFFALCTALLSVYSCTPYKNFHGILISDYDIDNIVIGETNIEYFLQKYGEPSFTGAFNNNVYYKHETIQISPAGKKEFLSRKILSLEIDENGIILSKNLLGLNDSLSLIPASGKTLTAGSDFTFFQQVFSNLRSGRFATAE
tara:strand:+ start:469 stop:915 length:447 start_codon:yes stop_codon:yes gene_type:complete